MMERRLQLTLGLTLNILILVAIKPTSGLYEAYLMSSKILFTNDTTYFNTMNGLKIKRVNRTHIVSGSFETLIEITNDYQLVSYVSKKSGSGYIRLPYKVGPSQFCKYYDAEPYIIEGLRKKSNLPPKGICPWPKKVYTIYNYELILDNIPPIGASGDYMVETQFLKDKKLLNGIQFYAKLEHV